MANIANVKSRLKAGALARFGETVFIHGHKTSAIFDYEELEDETGFYRVPLMMVASDEISLFQKGDQVLARNKTYKITHIQQSDDVLSEVRLKDA